ncbi:PAS domain S-box protein [Allocoleopsis franciscana]|uniref:Circadian input-output histidine kinase CikA n=1 Tax=Allocoleopsis franciscana PCC 7113 TaxID=1173027 RepID=K9WJJ5_9CYAN|nr:PAS domain S-box [Allocoleopsis franciscana PCC 7113]
MTQQGEEIALEQLFAGGGETGAMMRSLDWSRHPLGSVDQWPQSLKTMVRIMLTSRQPMFVWWGEQLINLYNDAYKSIVGGKHPKALGQPASEVWREIWDQVGPRAESAMLKNEGTYDEALLLIMERNGYPEETYYTFSYSPVPNDQGGTGGIICANTDDTQRIIGERQLSLLRELAAKTADARTFDDACTRSAKCLETNPYDLPFAMIYLVDPGQKCVVLTGTSGIDRTHAAVPETIALDSDSPWPFAEAIAMHKPCLVADLEALFGNLPMGAWQRPPHQAVVVPIAPSGQTGQAGILIVGLNPFRLFDDNYRGFIDLVAAQIAASIANAQAYEEERKRAEALAELDRAKTIFFSNISHEFRTPLTLMLGPLEEMLANSARLLPSERSHLETAHRNSLRLLKLVNTLLDFSRIEAGRVQAVYEPTDLAMFTADLAGMFRCAIEQAGMRLCVECPPLPEPVYVDREMWEKIVLNLLSNAFKFTWEGEITVALGWANDHVELEVRDTGTGIPAEEMPHLFERFHRVEGARGRTYEGSGIGLSLVQELVKLHGGTIQVSSVVDRGSCFTVVIPTGYAHIPKERISTPRTLASTAIGAATYVEEALRWLPEGAGEPGSRGAGEPGREVYPVSLNSCVPSAHILLADDNADMRDYVKRLLVTQGYEVETVGDGIAALARIHERTPDLVLTDVMMPRLDGLGLLRSLRDDPRTREIPIILLSARAGEKSRIEGLEAGADDYLIKPFSARELLARVEASLKLAQMRQEAASREEVLRAEVQSAKDTLENVLSRIRDQFLALDQDWRYTYTNDRVVEVTGKSREELLGKSIWELYPDTIGSQFQIEVQRAVAEQIPIQFEYFYPSLNRWFENRIYPSADGLSVFVADITNRKQAEEALQQREAELQLITDTVPALIAYVDRDCRYRFANRAFTRWFGKLVEEIIGQRVEEFVGETAYQYIRSDIEKALTGESVTSELWVPFRDGGSRYVRRQYIPDIDAQGEVRGFFAMITDLTDLKRTQEAFRASEERFSVIVNQATVGIAQMDLTAQFVLVNQKYCDIVGYPMAELLHKRKQDITHPEDLPYNMELFHRLVTRGESYALEKRYIRKDGSEVWVSNYVAAICDASGKPESAISVVLDISEQKAALRERQQAEAERERLLQELAIERARFEAVLRQMPAGVMIADAASGKLVLTNEQAKQIVGYDYEQSIQLAEYNQIVPFEGFRSDGQLYNPEDYPLMRSLQTGETITNEEIELQRGDGSHIVMNANSAPILDSKGQIIAAVVVFQDITERKRAEEALRQALLKLNFHVENTPMAVVEWDRDFRIIRWSAAAERILGWKAEEVIGKQLTELRFVYEEDAEAVAEVCRRLVYSEEPHIVGYNRNYTKDGDIVHCEWYNSSLRDELGRMTSVLSLVLDVTERKRAEQEREQLLKREQAARAESEAARSAAETANRIKDEFLAVLSHELRSPLNPILGWSRLLQTRKFDAAKTAEALATIERNAKLQAELIEDLLDVSRILRGKLSLNITSVALTSTIQAAMETVRLAAEAKSIQMSTKLEPQVGKVSGDASRLQQVVWNLLSNAIKFTPPGGRVDIQLERIDSYAQIVVSDTGKGIPVDFLPHVFDYFRQADATTTRKFGGLGLGLAIVRHLVELHGGTVQADSAGEGQGATFTVRLPLLLSPPQSDQDSEQPEPSLDLQGIEILVVDDDIDTREFVAFLLEQYGAQVTAVGTAGEALAALSQSVPDVLLSDIGMPEMDGYMLMQKVRTLPPEQGGQIPAIALTAYAGEINYQQALSAGFQSHLSKPVEPAELVALVTKLAQRQ